MDTKPNWCRYKACTCIDTYVDHESFGWCAGVLKESLDADTIRLCTTSRHDEDGIYICDMRPDEACGIINLLSQVLRESFMLIPEYKEAYEVQRCGACKDET